VRPVTTTSAPPTPTIGDLDGFIRQLESEFTATITVRRQSKEDAGFRQIYVSLDDERIAVLCAGEEVTREVSPGTHRLRVHNTGFWKSVDFSVAAGEHVSFSTINRPGWLTFSILAFFLGTNLLYVSLERDNPAGH
jgi:hypothetical protein